MKELLARLPASWENLPQSTKLLLAGLLLVGAVSLWYVGFYLPAQVPSGPVEVASPPSGEEPKALEVLPIPPLSQPAPVQAAPPTPKAQTPTATKPQELLLPQAQKEATPPNPFVPLLVEAPAPGPSPLPAPSPSPLPAPSPTVWPSPVPRGAPVRVSPGTPLPTPSLSSGPRPLPGSAGALPAPKVMAPRPRAEAPLALPEPPVLPSAPTGLVEALPPGPSKAKPGSQAPTIPKTPLQALVEEKGLKLAGTLLGPVSVAILESKEGYLVLPVGGSIPGSEAVIRRVEGERVVLALKDETLDLPLVSAQAGGEQ
ncbi:competence protein [Thermus sp.]|uniref:competence protein n=1 Tax=Thermus sp. TaxID=275 RepID=UPI003D09FF07